MDELVAEGVAVVPGDMPVVPRMEGSAGRKTEVTPLPPPLQHFSCREKHLEHGPVVYNIKQNHSDDTNDAYVQV